MMVMGNCLRAWVLLTPAAVLAGCQFACAIPPGVIAVLCLQVGLCKSSKGPKQQQECCGVCWVVPHTTGCCCFCMKACSLPLFHTAWDCGPIRHQERGVNVCMSPKCVCSSAAVECWPCLITLHIHSVTVPKAVCSDHGRACGCKWRCVWCVDVLVVVSSRVAPGSPCRSFQASGNCRCTGPQSCSPAACWNMRASSVWKSS